MNHDPDPHAALLHAPLTALRRETAALAAPPALEASLLAAFERHHRQRRRWRDWLTPSQWGWAGGSVATLALMLALSGPLREQADALQLVQVDDGAAFIALDSLERIAQEPAPRLVQTQIARADLAGAGVTVTPENADQPVRAEMLVAADGQPLALRLSEQ